MQQFLPFLVYMQKDWKQRLEVASVNYILSNIMHDSYGLSNPNVYQQMTK